MPCLSGNTMNFMKINHMGTIQCVSQRKAGLIESLWILTLSALGFFGLTTHLEMRQAWDEEIQYDQVEIKICFCGITN